MIGTKLLEIEPVYNKGQDTIILDWGDYQQTESYLEIQQYTDQRRR